jgi:hypothetical protein
MLGHTEVSIVSQWRVSGDIVFSALSFITVSASIPDSMFQKDSVMKLLCRTRVGLYFVTLKANLNYNSTV